MPRRTTTSDPGRFAPDLRCGTSPAGGVDSFAFGREVPEALGAGAMRDDGWLRLGRAGPAAGRDAPVGALRFVGFPPSAMASPYAPNPRHLTSGTRSMPYLSSTVSCTRLMTAITSAARAPPLFTMKFACMSDTHAPPTE